MQIFEMIDIRRKGFFTKSTLQTFLNKCVSNSKFTNEEVMCIYRRFNFEHDKVTFSNFVNAMLPLKQNGIL